MAVEPAMGGEPPPCHLKAAASSVSGFGKALRRINEEHELERLLAEAVSHPVLEFRHVLAGGRHADDHPDVLNQLLESVLVGQPLVVVLPVPRLGSVGLEPVENIW